MTSFIIPNIFKIINLFETPLTQWNSFKLGIINEVGEIIIEKENFTNKEQIMAFSDIHEYVLYMKLLYENYKNELSKEKMVWFMLTAPGTINENTTFQLVDFTTLKSLFSAFLAEEVMTTGSVGGLNEPVISKKQQNWYTWNNSRVYVVPTDKFIKSRFVKNPRKKYSDYVGDDEIGKEIREYGLKNPKASIILQDKQTGAMMYFKRGINHM